MAKKSSSSGSVGIKVDTGVVRTTVTTLTTLNKGMEDDFDPVINAMKTLDSSWDGSASSKAMSKFNSIKSNYCGSNGRKAVMNTFIQFLSNIVASDYETTETNNTKLSELFK